MSKIQDGHHLSDALKYALANPHHRVWVFGDDNAHVAVLRQTFHDHLTNDSNNVFRWHNLIREQQHETLLFNGGTIAWCPIPDEKERFGKCIVVDYVVLSAKAAQHAGLKRALDVAKSPKAIVVVLD